MHQSVHFYTSRPARPVSFTDDGAPAFLQFQFIFYFTTNRGIWADTSFVSGIMPEYPEGICLSGLLNESVPSVSGISLRLHLVSFPLHQPDTSCSAYLLWIFFHSVPAGPPSAPAPSFEIAYRCCLSHNRTRYTLGRNVGHLSE